MDNIVIVGAGQAGLAVSHLLAERGLKHVVVERAEPGAAWREQRWDSFHLVIPNGYWCMPGMEYDGDDPSGFLGRNEVVACFDDYVRRRQPPVRCYTEVLTVAPNDDPAGFLVRTTDGDLHAHDLVLAAGPYQEPWVPDWGKDLEPRLAQVHSSRYIGPGQLPNGAVLVVGSGQSGVQIAEELAAAGRPVILSVGSTGWVPRRYLGRDIVSWYVDMGMFDTPVTAFESLRAARASGFAQVAGDATGGHDCNIHTLAASGVRLVGRACGGAGGTISVGDLGEAVATSDSFAARARALVDEHVAINGIGSGDRTADPWPSYVPVASPGPSTVDLVTDGIRAVVWATGFSPGYEWLDVPGLRDDDGYLRHKRGIAPVAGLYFAGLEWQYRHRSATLLAGREDAAHVVDHIVARRAEGTSP